MSKFKLVEVSDDLDVWKRRNAIVFNKDGTVLCVNDEPEK